MYTYNLFFRHQFRRCAEHFGHDSVWWWRYSTFIFTPRTKENNAAMFTVKSEVALEMARRLAIEKYFLGWITSGTNGVILMCVSHMCHLMMLMSHMCHLLICTYKIISLSVPLLTNNQCQVAKLPQNAGKLFLTAVNSCGERYRWVMSFWMAHCSDLFELVSRVSECEIGWMMPVRTSNAHNQLLPAVSDLSQLDTLGASGGPRRESIT